MHLSITAATIHDVELLSQLSVVTFTEAFAADNRKEDMDQYLAVEMSPAKLIGELQDSNNLFLIAWHNDEPVGYAKMATGTHAPRTDACTHPHKRKHMHTRQQIHTRAHTQQKHRHAHSQAPTRTSTRIYFLPCSTRYCVWRASSTSPGSASPSTSICPTRACRPTSSAPTESSRSCVATSIASSPSTVAAQPITSWASRSLVATMPRT